MSPRTEDSPVPSCLTERKASILLIFWPRCSTCVILVPDQGSNLSPLQWKCRGLATGPPREVPEVNILIMCKAMHSLKALVPFRVRLLKAPPSSLSNHGGFHDGLEWASCFSSLEPLCFLFPLPFTLYFVGSLSVRIYFKCHCLWEAFTDFLDFVRFCLAPFVVVQLLSPVLLFAVHGLQHAGFPCPSLTPRVCSNSCLLSR